MRARPSGAARRGAPARAPAARGIRGAPARAPAARGIRARRARARAAPSRARSRDGAARTRDKRSILCVARIIATHHPRAARARTPPPPPAGAPHAPRRRPPHPRRPRVRCFALLAARFEARRADLDAHVRARTGAAPVYLGGACCGAVARRINSARLLAGLPHGSCPFHAKLLSAAPLSRIEPYLSPRLCARQQFFHSPAAIMNSFIACVLSVLAATALANEELEVDASSCAVKSAVGDFAYDITLPNNPSNWGNIKQEFAACKDGDSQSPINFPANVQYAPRGAGPRPRMALANMTFGASSYNWAMSCSDESGSCGTTVFGGKTYELINVHFHSPSEHKLFGKQYPLECHMVHAAEDGSLAVIGTMFDYRRANVVPGAHLPEGGARVRRRRDAGHGAGGRDDQPRGVGRARGAHREPQQGLLLVLGLADHAAVHGGRDVVHVHAGVDRVGATGARVLALGGHQHRRQQPTGAAAQRAPGHMLRLVSAAPSFYFCVCGEAEPRAPRGGSAGAAAEGALRGERGQGDLSSFWGEGAEEEGLACELR
ncbi:carbonic anhydrase [Gracilaria domingensis]|nr:carbonic anhydrase [Gracilaria domingensis]